MLWYTCHLVVKKLGITKSVRKCVQNIWRLKSLDRKFEAEIVLSKAPCKQYEKFQKDIEELTGVKFTFPIMDNVAQVAPVKDKNGYEIYPRFAAFEDSQENIQEALEMLEYGISPQRNGERMVVEVRNQNTQHEAMRTSSPTYSQVVATKTVQKRNKAITIVDSDDESEWEAPSYLKYSNTYSPRKVTPTKQAAYALPTPDSIPLDMEARRRAEKIMRKQKKSHSTVSDESPTVAKKSRWDGYI